MKSENIFSFPESPARTIWREEKHGSYYTWNGTVDNTQRPYQFCWLIRPPFPAETDVLTLYGLSDTTVPPYVQFTSQSLLLVDGADEFVDLDTYLRLGAGRPKAWNCIPCPLYEQWSVISQCVSAFEMQLVRSAPRNYEDISKMIVFVYILISESKVVIHSVNMLHLVRERSVRTLFNANKHRCCWPHSLKSEHRV